MRAIEFRAWDKKRNTMFLSPEELEYLGTWFDTHLPGAIANKDNIEIEQFIGLLDKNGIKIYENDIIKAFGIIYKVEFNMGAFHFVNGKYNLDWRSVMNNERIYSYYDPMFFEKVGNIHQNQELIKEKCE
jgi:uncharacterized phage protein (TIGR01671 family)